MDQKKIWDHFQNAPETASVFDNAYPRYVFLAKQVNAGASILNVGVGRGGLEIILHSKGALVHALDPSNISIENLNKIITIGERAKVGFSQAIPFPDKTFDVVIMSEVLEHLENEVLENTLIEVRRVLKPRALFIGTVPANESLLENYAVCPHCGVNFHRWGHVQSFSKERIKNIILNKGFSRVSSDFRSFPDWRKKGISSFFKNSVRYILGRFGLYISSPHIYFSATN